MIKNVSIICANIRGNLGDYAIIEATGRALERLYGENIRISVAYHSFTGVDRSRTERFLQSLPAFISLENETAFCRPRYSGRILHKIGVGEKVRARFLYEYAKFKLRRDRDFIAMLDRSDLVVMAGGGHYGGALLSSNMLAQITVALERSKRVCAFPQTVPMDWWSYADPGLVGQLIDRMEFFPLREYRSYRFLSESLTSDRLVDSADIVFSLEIDSLPEKNSSSRRRIGIVLADTGTRKGQQYAEELHRILHDLSASGWRPVVITTTESVDRSYLDSLKRLDPELEIEAPMDWRELLRLFASLDVIVTNRFHGIVFSTLADVPVLPVIDVPKTAHLAETMDLPYRLENEKLLDNGLLERMVGDSEKILESQRAYRTKARKRIDELLQRLEL